ncbi:MAG: hypothetical protein ACRYFX_23170 [Janthinobacterium lividum]
MLTNLALSADKQTVTWENDEQPVHLAFDYPVRPHHIEYLNTVLILRESWGNGERVFTIYHADGSVKARPGLPKRPHQVGGIYSIWYNQGQRKQTVVLFSDEFKPWDTACDFDLETYEFSNFHPTN